jgi:hypothetical protein
MTAVIPMKPGAIVTCSTCGASSLPLHTTGHRGWEEGGALVETWTNGPFPRHLVAREGASCCAWCADRARGWPALMNRPLDGENWTAGGPKLTYAVPPIPGLRARSIGEGLSTAASKASPPPVDAASSRPLSNASRGQLSLL